MRRDAHIIELHYISHLHTSKNTGYYLNVSALRFVTPSKYTTILYN